MSGLKDILIPHPDYDLILSADYSQLEVVVLAQLAGPGRLREDILSRVDIHTALLSMRVGVPYEELKAIIDNQDDPNHSHWVAERKINKRMSFQLQYGAGAESMAQKLGLEPSVTRQFIKSYYSRYPEVKKLQEKWINLVEQRATPSGRRSVSGYPVKYGWLDSQTGRKYVFYEQDNPPHLRKRYGNVSFNPPNIKNYPVQGLATGDLVPIGVANLNDRILNEGIYNKFALANTVHDSVVGYTQKDFVDIAAKMVKDELEGVAEYVKNRYNMELFTKPAVEI